MQGCVLTLMSQAPSLHPPLEAQGIIPAEVLWSVEESYHAQLSQRVDLSNVQSNFFLQNASQVQSLLHSGKVLFQDEASLYLEAIADQVLRDRPELRKNLRFYVVRSPEINAFATNDGCVFVNMGLLAHVKHEAQLAFILSHEISHYLQQHPLAIYLNQSQEEAEKKASKGQSRLPSTRYTREKELEADRLGWEIFLEAGYDPAAGLDAFELLSGGTKPFGSTFFQLSWLKVASLPFPQDYLLKELLPEAKLPSQERQSSHPDPEKRKFILEEFMRLQSPEPGQYFFLPITRFETLRERCRYEVVRLQLLNRQYEQALYHTFLLQIESPYDPELDRFMAIALYSLAKYANAGRLWDVHLDPSQVTAPQQRLHFLIGHLQPQELSAIALHHVWKYHRKYPQDEALKRMSRDLMEDLSAHYLEALQLGDTTVSSPRVIFFPAMVEMMQDSAFAADIGSLLVRNQQMKDLLETSMMRPSRTAPTASELDLIGLRMGLDRVVWVEPFYQVFHHRPKDAGSLLESEQKAQDLMSHLQTFSKGMGFEHEILSSAAFEPQDIHKYQDLSMLQTWIQERSQHDHVELVSPLHNEVHALTEKYHTRYFAWIGVVAQQERRKGKGIVATASILFPPLIPYGIWYLSTPRSETLIYTAVYDGATGQYVLLYPKIISMKDRPDVVRSALYDLLLQLSSE